MVAPRLRLHQTVFAILAVQAERAIDQNKSGYDAKADTNPLVDARHEHHHEHDKQTEQPACEYEQVLTFQALKFRRFTNSPVY